MQMLSPERIFVNTLEYMKHDKWGFVIYRCTYRNDQDWDRFKEIVHERTQESMQRSDAPEVADSLEWTFVEDRAALDGASRSQLRERFNQWVERAFNTEQPRDQTQHDRTFTIPRYNYFIQVDEEALQSVLAAPKRDPCGEGFVNLVDSRWKPFSREEYGDAEVFDPIDGCTQEDVGWMRIAAMMIDATWYETAFDFPGGVWHVYYKRPPEIVLY